MFACLSTQTSAQQWPIIQDKELNGAVTKTTAEEEEEEEEQQSFLPVTGKVLVEHESSV